ncbi:hypothetical protein E4T56_gene11890 [Termitomyces sp. T112]|nr:hypothetical protein E4T56_gene11890 [Termitomyces sp. T112]
MPNPPTDANYFGPPNPRGPPPPRWAPGPAPGSMGQNPGGGPPNGGPPGGWGPAMDNFPPQRGNGNHYYYYYYNAGPPPRTQNSQDDTRDTLAWEAEVKYLGVIVTPDSVRMDPTKVDAILNWPSPRNVKEVQSFLGFANFYCCFIDNYSGITKPLNRLTWKDTPWDWDSKCQSVFLLLKKAFTSALVLRHFDPSLPIVLECDTSDYAIAGILSQLNSGGKDLCPVTFYT